jgi:hypothetical protein
VCGNYTLCTSNQYQSVSPGPDNDRGCTAYSLCRAAAPVVVQQLCADCSAAINGTRPVPAACINDVLQNDVCQPGSTGWVNFTGVAAPTQCQICQEAGSGSGSQCINTAVAWATAVCSYPWQQFESVAPTATSDR